MSGLEPRLSVLLVEDSPLQVRLVRYVIADLPILHVTHVAEDGVQAMEFLRGEGRHAGRTLPDVVLCDINMPNKNGFEVLDEVKADECLRHIPFVMLTTSENEDDVMKAYQGGANTFISKPIDVFGLEKVLAHFAHYWQAAKHTSQRTVGQFAGEIATGGETAALSGIRPVAPKSVDVLLVEDSIVQSTMIRGVVQMLPEFNFLGTMADGHLALDYLRRKGSFTSARRPHLVLLDINLPGKDGFDVLREIKADADLRTIVVVVLTVRDQPEDIIKCYNLRANTFLTKPVNIDGMRAVLHRFAAYWADEAIKLPPQP